MESNFPCGGQLKDEIVGAEVVPSSSDAWLNRQVSSYNSRSGLNVPGFVQSSARTSGSLILDGNNGCGTTPLHERSQIHDGISRQSEKNLVPCSVSSPSTAFRMEEVSSSSLADQLATVHMRSKVVDHGRSREDLKLTQNGLAPSEQRIQSELFQAVNNSLVHPDESMPLSQHINGFVHDFQNLDNKMQHPGSTNAKLEDRCIQPPSGDDLFDILASEGISDFGIFFGTGTAHLLAHRAAKQNSDDDDVSCRTTSTRISTASVPSSSLTYGCNSTSNHVQGEALQLPEPMHNAGTVKSSSLKTGCSKDNCSIDALLECTIKHMLFLQSVTKHADKLKQTGESKIIDKEGGLLLKDNFEGGATWAFEVGSQSMMLCEERGFFLEIADLIRAMILTILKGVMEARNDKIWARCAVEYPLLYLTAIGEEN
ncbi:hypothetical protein FEM48_Zijuj02G0007400 [Ziziphus jujuba var. spinosa]|uniref:BHLH domain-containing protein n=1 Tax=Ziziphus jujuba var. spinosa TaxID=714518 RepID=A0A978VSL8_ZIZJJ|nr:hypothetical protein FEM48_Zijuj02G0007400 [Ziziphus jujuba var. spinosa]